VRVPATRLVVLVSGAGTNLQALLDAAQDPAYGAEVVAVGADRDDIEGLARADRAGVPTFVRKVADFTSRGHWDITLTDTVAAFEPDLVVLAGFMKLVGPEFLGRFAGRVVNTHPALCPAFPGTTAPADALAYGVKVTGATLFVVDEGVDTGPIILQRAVELPGASDPEAVRAALRPLEHDLLTDAVRLIALGAVRVDPGARRVSVSSAPHGGDGSAG
jgi:phosphoribosylglycinamide formyltransferase-1